MPLSPIAQTAMFTSTRRRTSLVHAEDRDSLGPHSPNTGSHSALHASTSGLCINPFGRTSISVDRDRGAGDDHYVATDSLSGSRRRSAATIISTLLHLPNKDAGWNHDGYSSEDAASSTGSNRLPLQQPSTPTMSSSQPQPRRPSAFLRAWKIRRTSHSTQSPLAPQQSHLVSSPTCSASACATGRRKSSALTRVLTPSAFRTNASPRVDQHARVSTLSDDHSGRRRSLSIVCRGERDSDDLDPVDRIACVASSSGAPDRLGTASAVTAAMAIRDSWLYSSERAYGSASTITTWSAQSNGVSINSQSSVGCKSLSAPWITAVGLDVEDAQIQLEHQKQRLRNLRQQCASGAKWRSHSAGVSVVSLSLTEEIALYTSDVHTVETNTRPARTTTGATSSADDACMARSHSVATIAGRQANKNRHVPDPEAQEFACSSSLPDRRDTVQRIARGTSVGAAEARLAAQSAAPAVTIADAFSRFNLASQQGIDDMQRRIERQRVESGSLDPVFSRLAARSPSLHTPTSEAAASDGHGARLSSDATRIQWQTPQWNSASPFRPDAPTLFSASSTSQPHPSVAASASYYSTHDQSPTSSDFPPAATSVVGTVVATNNEPFQRRATTYYDASALPAVEQVRVSSIAQVAHTTSDAIAPRSPTASLEMRTGRRCSFSLPRSPPGYEHMITHACVSAAAAAAVGSNDDEELACSHAPTPRLMSLENDAVSPLSSNFEPETPSVSAIFPASISGDVEKLSYSASSHSGLQNHMDGLDDLHAQFCSALLLDLGNGTTIPLSPSPGTDPRQDPFALLAH